MAKTKATTLLLLALIAISMLATEVMGAYWPGNPYDAGTVKPEQCKGRCEYRCSNTQYYNNCILFCNKCCNKCLCVPPGTYGYKWVCPCYNNWKTQEGGPKCP